MFKPFSKAFLPFYACDSLKHAIKYVSLMLATDKKYFLQVVVNCVRTSLEEKYQHCVVTQLCSVQLCS